MDALKIISDYLLISHKVYDIKKDIIVLEHQDNNIRGNYCFDVDIVEKTNFKDFDHYNFYRNTFRFMK